MNAFERTRVDKLYSDEKLFLSEIEDCINRVDFDIRRDGNRYLMQVEGHFPFTVKKPKSKNFMFWRETYVYEPVSVALFSFLLKKFDISVVFDIGARDGYFSLLASAFKARPVEVHSFEMVPDHNRRMKAVAASQVFPTDRWHIHVAAIADCDEGTRKIWFSRNFLFESEPKPEQYKENVWRRAKFALRGIHNRDRLQTAEIEFTSVDAFVEKTGVSPDLLKVDIDGYEGRFVEGALETLRTKRPFLLLEVHKDKMMNRTPDSRKSIFERLFSLGYQAVLLSDHNNRQRNVIKKMSDDSPELTRQKTDQFLFY
jgi:FkbM family methyltransferase